MLVCFQQLRQPFTVTVCWKWCMLNKVASRCWSSFNVDAYNPHYTSAQLGSSIARRSFMRRQKPLSCLTFHISCGHVWVWCDLLCKVTFHLVTLCSGFDRSVTHLPYLQTVLSSKTVGSMVARLQRSSMKAVLLGSSITARLLTVSLLGVYAVVPRHWNFTISYPTCTDSVRLAPTFTQGIHQVLHIHSLQ